MNTPNVSLWDIEASVSQIVSMLDDPEISEDERAVAVAELERWVCASVRKVDAIRSLIRNCDQREAEAVAAVNDAKAELERQRARAAVFANRRERVKSMCLEAMQAMGLRKIEGKTGRLRIQGSGGKQAMKITNEPLVPDEYRVFSFKLPANNWQALQSILFIHGLHEFLRCMLLTATPSIDEPKLRAALELKCMKCDGNGIVEDFEDIEGENPCKSCNGTGKERVPGAELLPRGETLRVD